MAFFPEDGFPHRCRLGEVRLFAFFLLPNFVSPKYELTWFSFSCNTFTRVD